MIGLFAAALVVLLVVWIRREPRAASRSSTWR